MDEGPMDCAMEGTISDTKKLDIILNTLEKLEIIEGTAEGRNRNSVKSYLFN